MMGKPFVMRTAICNPLEAAICGKDNYDARLPFSRGLSQYLTVSFVSFVISRINDHDHIKKILALFSKTSIDQKSNKKLRRDKNYTIKNHVSEDFFFSYATNISATIEWQ